jgi:hypothetical protein
MMILICLEILTAWQLARQRLQVTAPGSATTKSHEAQEHGMAVGGEASLRLAEQQVGHRRFIGRSAHCRTAVAMATAAPER